MPELRLNLITREWVIIATERAHRPDEFRRERSQHAALAVSHECPFCPGQEARTPDETYRDGNPWRVRAFPNKFSALSQQGEPRRLVTGLKRTVEGVGRHEVIVETPRHDGHLAFLSDAEFGPILSAYRHRFLDLYADPRVRHVILFKNHGEEAGTSLAHSHAQIVGTPVVPLQVRDRLVEYIHYLDSSGECLMCRIIADERADGTRIVAENERFVAFVPYAALSPFHLWIFPKDHHSCFGGITDEALADLGRVLGKILRTLYVGLGDPPYNLVLRSLGPEEAGVDYFHWYIAVVPRVAKAAGFELGSGMYINTALPEQSAAFLRGVRDTSPRGA